MSEKKAYVVWAQNAGDGDYAALYLDGKMHFETWSGPVDPVRLLQSLEGVNVGSVDIQETEHPFLDKNGKELEKSGWPDDIGDLSPALFDKEDD